jgi:cyclic peptide transporter
MFTYFAKKLGKMLALAAVCSSVSALLALALFAMISRARSGSLDGFDVLLYGALWLGLVAMSACNSTMLSKLSSNAIYQTRMSLIRRILGTTYDKLERAGSARLYNVLTGDVAAISSAVSELPTFVFNAILLASCLSYLAYLSPPLFMVLALTIGVSFFVSKTLIARLGKQGRAMRESQDAMLNGYKGMLDGSAQLAIDAAQKRHFYASELHGLALTLRGNERRFRLYWDLNRAVTVALIFLMLGALIQAARFLGDQSLVLTYALIVTYCAGPFAVVVNLLQLFSQARVSLGKIENLQIDAETEPQDPPQPPAWKSIRFAQVEFAYRTEGSETPFVLGPIDLEIHRGEVMFITGGNGSGKSTFIKLLLGLAEPTAGDIFVDGVRQAWNDNASYRALFSMVLADFHLFRQVLDADGKPAADADVEALLARFNLSAAVKVKDGVFDTVRLSQGQKKRLALVAAIARRRDIYVLDEWAADQDPHYRKVFYEEIIPWLAANGATVVAVTHDDRYFDAADRQVDFEAGRIRSGASGAVAGRLQAHPGKREMLA